ncbi:hypothetical protein AB0K80_10695 [Streptomyces sp. NPDC052682]|uniref:hypothetical protein n=1 Tax=Streptomyces sp. NPDC052682 TaxID=3154954 RepID=UPI003416B3FA
MGLGIVLFGLFFLAGWAVALAALVRAVVTLVRIRSLDWVRDRGHPAVRLLLPTPAYLRLDRALAVSALAADLWLVSAVVVFGADGVFTEDWMGSSGMMDPTGQAYQAAAVSVLRTVGWWTFAVAALCRCWVTAGVQLGVLPLAAWWIGSFDTYYT